MQLASLTHLSVCVKGLPLIHKGTHHKPTSLAFQGRNASGPVQMLWAVLPPEMHFHTALSTAMSYSFPGADLEAGVLLKGLGGIFCSNWSVPWKISLLWYFVVVVPVPLPRFCPVFCAIHCSQSHVHRRQSCLWRTHTSLSLPVDHTLSVFSGPLTG